MDQDDNSLGKDEGKIILSSYHKLKSMNEEWNTNLLQALFIFCKNKYILAIYLDKAYYTLDNSNSSIHLNELDSSF